MHGAKKRGFLVASRERLLEDQTFTVKPSGSPFRRPLDCSISSALYLYGLVAVHWKGGKEARTLQIWPFGELIFAIMLIFCHYFLFLGFRIVLVLSYHPFFSEYDE